MSTWTDSRCGKSWGGLKAEHCPGCCETFANTTAGDKHRTRDFKCTPPAEVGLVLDERKQVWRLPITPEARERLAALGQRKAGVPLPADGSVICGHDSPGPIPESPPEPSDPAEADSEAQS